MVSDLGGECLRCRAMRTDSRGQAVMLVPGSQADRLEFGDERKRTWKMMAHVEVAQSTSTSELRPDVRARREKEMNYRQARVAM